MYNCKHNQAFPAPQRLFPAAESAECKQEFSDAKILQQFHKCKFECGASRLRQAGSGSCRLVSVLNSGLAPNFPLIITNLFPAPAQAATVSVSILPHVPLFQNGLVTIRQSTHSLATQQYIVKA